MRNIINIIEAQNLQAGQDEVTGFAGSVDIRGLMALLPHVTDPNQFQTAFNKVKNGEMGRLTNQERTQLALAFISLLGDDQNTKRKVIAKLTSLKELPAKQPSQQQPQQQPQQPPAQTPPQTRPPQAT